MASRPTRALLLLLAVTAVAVACSTPKDAPVIDAISPAFARNNLAVQRTITGRNFFRSIVPDARNPSHSALGDLTASLSIQGGPTYSLVLTTNVTSTSIVAIVPSNLAPGVYTVSVHADGGTATSVDSFTVSGTPTKFLLSSGTEPPPGDSDIVPVTVTVADTNGNTTTLDPGTSVPLTVQFNGATTSAIADLPAFSIAGSAQTFSITDPRVESFGVTVIPQLGSPMTVTTGSATFIAGPAYRGHALDASEPSPFLSDSASTAFVIEDIDGNLVANHATTFQASVFAQSGGGCPSPLANPPSVVVTDGAASAAFTVTCGANVTDTVLVVVTIISPPGGLVASNGHITFK